MRSTIIDQSIAESAKKVIIHTNLSLPCIAAVAFAMDSLDSMLARQQLERRLAVDDRSFDSAHPSVTRQTEDRCSSLKSRAAL